MDITTNPHYGPPPMPRDELPPGEFCRKAAKNIKVGDWVDIYFQYGYKESLYSKVEKITNHHNGYISICVERRPHWVIEVTERDRTIQTIGPRVMIHTWRVAK